MTKMSEPILKPIKESLSIISKNKKLFFLIFALQALYFLAFSAVSGFYIVKIVESSEEVMVEVESLNLGTDQLEILQQKSPLGQEMQSISDSYSSLTRNFWHFSLFIFLLFLFFSGMAWYLISGIVEKEKHLFSVGRILNYFAKFFVWSVVFFMVVYFLLLNVLKVFFSDFLGISGSNFIPLVIVGLVLLHFIYLSAPFLYKAKFNKKETKKLFKRILTAGIKHLPQVLLSYFIIAAAIALSSYLMFLFIDGNFILLALSVIIFIAIFVWTKVFFYVVVKGLSGF